MSFWFFPAIENGANLRKLLKEQGNKHMLLKLLYNVFYRNAIFFISGVNGI